MTACTRVKSPKLITLPRREADVDDPLGGDAALRGVVAADLAARRIGIVDDDGDVARAQADARQGEPRQRAVGRRRRALSIGAGEDHEGEHQQRSADGGPR